ncbi:hypothetical protein K435DRAFT_875010 [Dendrothele bispora CBS 962.96]|uniref:Uncharacterized protein n=1 Tax=Dendrothele bispora (strain CBS 962.96) TaxID=1314807 RepID=A0A4S8KVI4_DENBC|nr:hypothetical protein K435DRAFT_875010 [Dendrothele bispora CBS 962.96]
MTPYKTITPDNSRIQPISGSNTLGVVSSSNFPSSLVWLSRNIDMKADSKGRERFWRPLHTTGTPATI